MTMMRMPVTQTSNIDNFRRNTAISNKNLGRFRVACTRIAMINNTAMSKTVNTMTKTLNKKNAIPELASQCFLSSSWSGDVHSSNLVVQFQRVTSSAAISCTCNISMRGFKSIFTFPDSNNKFMSKRSAIQGSVKPMTNTMANPMQKTIVQISIAIVLKRHLPPGSSSSRWSSCLVGARTPSDETVDATQKVAKQLKPMSKSICPSMIGGW
mmetsp:Transcript_83068/g.240393  ORF Transcript_83068/g.240393 Transcript_83068/m.240393 type:complete len:211 (-) Transcript_83068:620-1252(-)